MSDNIFDRLMELLQSPGPINWALGQEIAGSIAGEREPIDPDLADEYIALTDAAVLHVANVSGLSPDTSEVHPIDRAGWAESNLRAFRYLVEPIAAKMNDAPAGPLDPIMKQLGPAILGMQAGSMVGFMSQRVLGQFDIGMPTMDRPGIFYVVPNIEAFAKDHQIDPPQARLWVALHEVAHSAEFAVRWVRPHFLLLVEEYFAGLEFDPSSIAERLESMERPEDLEQLMQQPGGVAGLLAGPEQRDVLDRIQAFMALVDGYADYVMRQAAPNLIPAAPQIAEAIVRRRAEPTQGEQVLQQLMGLELNRQQYRLGVAFCEEVTRRWGEKELARIWESPERLPTLSELEDPVGWAARLL